MMGVPLTGPSSIFCDNRSVVLSSTLPSNTLKKKHNAIAYHKVRESVAANVITVSHIKGEETLADILTKPVDGQTFRKHVGKCMLKIGSSTRVPHGGVSEGNEKPADLSARTKHADSVSAPAKHDMLNARKPTRGTAHASVDSLGTLGKIPVPGESADG